MIFFIHCKLDMFRSYMEYNSGKLVLYRCSMHYALGLSFKHTNCFFLFKYTTGFTKTTTALNRTIFVASREFKSTFWFKNEYSNKSNVQSGEVFAILIKSPDIKLSIKATGTSLAFSCNDFYSQSFSFSIFFFKYIRPPDKICTR